MNFNTGQGNTNDGSDDLQRALDRIKQLEREVCALTKVNSDRKRIQEELKRSEERYRRLFSSMMDAYALVDMEGKVIEFNESFRSMLGYSADELRTHKYADLTPEKWNSIESTIANEQILQRGYSDVYEKEYRRKDGTILPVELRTFLLTDDSGNPTGMWAIVRDISERKETETTLRQNEQKYRLLFDHAGAGVAEVDSQTGRFIRINKKYCDIVGYTMQESEHLNFQIITHPDDLSDDLKNMDLLKSGSINEFTMTKRYFHKDGHIVWVHLSVSTTRPVGTKLTSHIAVVFDITLQKKAEVALRESETRLIAFLNSSAIIAWIKDVEGRRVFLSDNYVKRFRVQPNWRGKNDFEMWPQDIAEVYRRNDLTVLKSDKPIEVIEKAVEPDGSYSWWLNHKFTFIDSAGQNFIGGLGVDITEQKRAQDELKTAKEYAENLIKTASVLIIGMNTIGNLTIMNETAEDVLGYKKEELIGLAWFEIIVPKTRFPHVWEQFLRLEKGDLPVDFENPVQCKDGEERIISWRNSQILKNGVITGTLSFGLDITKRKHAEMIQQRLNRHLRALSDCNQILIRAEHEQSLLDEVCDIICQSGYRMAWVSFFDHNTNGYLKPIASAGETDSSIKNMVFDFTLANFHHSNTEKVMVTGKTAIIENFSDNDTPSWCKKALELGYRAAIILALKDENGRSFGVMTIYSKEANIFIPDEVKLLEELAGDLAYGICNLRSRIKRSRSEISLRESEANLKSALSQREKLIQELFHRTKNNMQVISAMLDLEAIRSQTEHMLYCVKKMKLRLSAMALSQEKLYQSKSLSLVNLKSFLIDLVALLSKSLKDKTKEIDISIEAEDASVVIDIAIPFGLIITELLSNSFEHAFPQRNTGLISISLRKLEMKEYELVISDNGVGNLELFDIRKLTSLGIPLVISIAEKQLQGSIGLIKSRGFEWKIRFRSDIYNERV